SSRRNHHPRSDTNLRRDRDRKAVRTLRRTPHMPETAARSTKRRWAEPSIARNRLPFEVVAEPFCDLAASRGQRERSAHFAHSLDRQTGDPGAKQLLGDQREVVERERA